MTSTSAIAQVPINLVNTFGQWLTGLAGLAFLAGGAALAAGRPWGRYAALLAACVWGVATLCALLALGTFFYFENVALDTAVVAAVLALLNAGGPPADQSPHGRYFERGLYVLGGAVFATALFAYAGIYWWLGSKHPYLLEVPGQVRLAAVDAEGFPGGGVVRSLHGVEFVVPPSFQYMTSTCETDRGRTMMMVDRGRKIHLEVSYLTQYDHLSRELPLLGGVHGFAYGHRYAFERIGLAILWVKTDWSPERIDEIDLPEWHGFRYWYATAGKAAHYYALWHRATGRAFELGFYVPYGRDEHELLDAVAASVRLGGKPKAAAAYHADGEELLSAGRYGDAAYAFAQATQEECANVDHHYAIATTVLRAGEPEDARCEAMRVLRFKPGHEGARAVIDMAEKQLDEQREKLVAPRP